MKKSIITIFKYALLFLVLFVFFYRLCPIVPYVGDDWYFLGAMRQPIPYSGVFNPSKVFPEILQPICGYIGAYVIYPITHNYVDSISISASIIVSLFIVLLCYLFFNVLRKKLNFSFKKATLYELLFLIIFFVIFKRETPESYYGFWSINFTCYFNYLLPGIINACIVLYMMSFDDFNKSFFKLSIVSKGLFLTGLYFCIFSSIQLNIIVASYAILKLFTNAVKALTNKELRLKDKLIDFLKNSWIYLVIIATWIVAVAFDLSGQRGKMVSSSNWLNLDNLIMTIKNFYWLYGSFFKPLLVILVIGLIILFIYSIRKKETKYLKKLNFFGYLCGINVLYLVVIYMKAGSGYASRVDGTWGVLFYLIIFIMYVIIACNKIYNKTGIVVPAMIILFTLVSINLNYPFKQSVFDARTAKEIDNYIINQIVEADNKDENKATVRVPKYASAGSNWPLPYNMAWWLQNTLYSHGITRNRMTIEFFPDESLTEKFLNKDYTNRKFVDFERSREY